MAHLTHHSRINMNTTRKQCVDDENEQSESKQSKKQQPMRMMKKKAHGTAKTK